MKRCFLVIAFLFVMISNVSWAGNEVRVKCGETATVYTNLTGSGHFVTILVTDKCRGLDSAILYENIEDSEELLRFVVPDGQSIICTLPIGFSDIKLECNGAKSKGFCTFSIIGDLCKSQFKSAMLVSM